MSVDYYTYLINGIRYDPEDAIMEVANPMYGKFKFDPQTGKKVLSVIRDTSGYDEIREFTEKDYKLCVDLSSESGTKGCASFYGDVTKIDAGSFLALNTHLAVPTCMKKITNLMVLLDKHGVKYELGKFVISYCSY